MIGLVIAIGVVAGVAICLGAYRGACRAIATIRRWRAWRAWRSCAKAIERQRSELRRTRRKSQRGNGRVTRS